MTLTKEILFLFWLCSRLQHPRWKHFYPFVWSYIEQSKPLISTILSSLNNVSVEIDTSKCDIISKKLASDILLPRPWLFQQISFSSCATLIRLSSFLFVLELARTIADYRGSLLGIVLIFQMSFHYIVERSPGFCRN